MIDTLHRCSSIQDKLPGLFRPTGGDAHTPNITSIVVSGTLNQGYMLLKISFDKADGTVQGDSKSSAVL